MGKQLAKISNAKLIIKDRGILTFWIYVDYEEGMSQCIGGMALDTYDKERQERIGTAYGCEMIRRLFIELGVNDFSEMAGQHIWVYGKGSGLGFTPTGISALYTNNKNSKPVIFAEVAEEFGL